MAGDAVVVHVARPWRVVQARMGSAAGEPEAVDRLDGGSFPRGSRTGLTTVRAGV